MRATYKDRIIYQGREKVKLESGQFLMGYEEFADTLNLPTSTVYFWLDEFEDNDMVKIKSNTKGTIVTIKNWGDYQELKNERKTNEKQMKNEKKANEKREEPNNKDNKGKKVNKDNGEQSLPYKKIVSYLNEKADRKFKPSSKKTRKKIQARFNEGFELEDFKDVIDTKVADWKDDNEMQKYLRPRTLFSNKFEDYLNEEMPSKDNGRTNPTARVKDTRTEAEKEMGI